MISQVRLFAASSPAEQFPRHSFAHKSAGVLLRLKNEFADFHDSHSVNGEAGRMCAGIHSRNLNFFRAEVTGNSTGIKRYFA
jgi:hypothetical protein